MSSTRFPVRLVRHAASDDAVVAVGLKVLTQPLRSALHQNSTKRVPALPAFRPEAPGAHSCEAHARAAAQAHRHPVHRARPPRHPPAQAALSQPSPQLRHRRARRRHRRRRRRQHRPCHRCRGCHLCCRHLLHHRRLRRPHPRPRRGRSRRRLLRGRPRRHRGWSSRSQSLPQANAAGAAKSRLGGRKKSCLARAAPAARRGGGATNPAVSGMPPAHRSGRCRWSAAAATQSGFTASRPPPPRHRNHAAGPGWSCAGPKHGAWEGRMPVAKELPLKG